MKPDFPTDDTPSQEFEGQTEPESDSNATESAHFADDQEAHLPQARR